MRRSPSRMLAMALGYSPESLRRQGANAGWTLVERAVSVLSALTVSVLLARHLGLDEFGRLQYCISIVAIIGMAVNLGLDSIVVRDMAREPEKRGEIVVAVLIVRAVAVFMGGVACLAGMWVMGEGGETLLLTLVLLVALLPLAFYGVEAVCLALNRAKIPAQARLAGSLAAVAYVMVCVYVETPLIAIGGYAFIEALTFSLTLIIWFRAGGSRQPIRIPSRARFAGLLRDVGPMTFSLVMVGLMANLDKLVVARILGEEALGVYAVASKISGAVQQIPTAICGALLPALVRLERDPESARRAYAQLYELMLVVSVMIAVPILLLGDTLISLMYGDRYFDSAGVLALQICYLWVVALAVAQGRWLIAHGRVWLYSLRSGVGLIVLGAMLAVLVKGIGLHGAVIGVGIASVSVLAFPLLIGDLRSNDRLALISALGLSHTRRALRLGLSRPGAS